MATAVINLQPDQANTPSVMVGDLEATALATLQGVAPDTVRILAPNGPMPFDPTSGNFSGLPNVTGVQFQIQAQQRQQSGVGLILLLILLWVFLR